MSEVTSKVSEIATAITEFKERHASEVSALRDRVEELEAKRTVPPAPARKAVNRDAIQIGDVTIPVMRKGADYAAHYQGDDEGLTFAELMRGVAGMKTSEPARKALSVGTAAAGGHAVPTVLMPEILEALAPASAVLSAGGGIVDVASMPGSSHSWAAMDTVPTAAWRAEAGAVSESDPTFRLVSAAPKSLSFYFKVSRELLADAPNVDGALRQAVAQAFAKEIDRASLRGSGAGAEPTGILNTASVGAVTNGANGATQSSLRWGNLHSAVSTILSFDAPMPSAAVMAPRSAVGYSSLADTTNQPLQRPSMLAGMRFEVTSQIPVNLTVGTSSDCTEIFVGDFSRVLVVMRERPTVMLANDLFALTGQVGFVCHVRADIVVTYPRAFAVITGVRAG